MEGESKSSEFTRLLIELEIPKSYAIKDLKEVKVITSSEELLTGVLNHDNRNHLNASTAVHYDGYLKLNLGMF